MKYSINFENHKTFKIFEENKLPPRAYFIPFSGKSLLIKTDLRRERYESDMINLLSGEWDFKFYKKKSKMPATLDTARLKFDNILVPSVWQREGHYQEPVYLNCPYEFKAVPPELPEDMPCGVYRKEFIIDDALKNHLITFLGAANNIDLYINGQHVGYSEGSHNSAEFDITPYIKNGANELMATSFKWCNGSYLEAQDFFRENGIFRDVYITKQPEVFIEDYKVTTIKGENGYDLGVEVRLSGNTGGCRVEAELQKGSDTICSAVSGAKESVADTVIFTFKDLDVLEWNAEIPNLYELYLTLSKDEKELMSLRSLTGFKTVKIDGEVFLFNCAKIKLKGVNHHDTHPVRGYAMTFDDLERDIKLMKSLNVNALRTSHYPPDPFFLILADVYGLYVIEEADIETHGLWDLGVPSDHLSNDLKWAKHYVDRVKRMYYRDRNRVSVTLWSLGNEADGYKCQDACYKFLKDEGTPIPVHYEGVIHSRRHSYDVISEMYTDIYRIRKMAKHKRTNNFKLDKRYHGKPFMLCEYAHAMGAGPGCLKEYWDAFYSSDQLMGGCIWEWADHAVYHAKDDKKYKYEYTYGGDHGEKRHDGHFCVDGLMYPDRTPHTGALEMQAVYRPVRAEQKGNGVYEFLNTNRFRSAGYLKITWELLENGVVIDSGKLGALDIAPVSSKEIAIKHKAINEDKDYHINFSYFDGGECLATEQLTLNDVEYEYEFEIGEKISVESCDGVITVNFENGCAKFLLADGTLFSYNAGGTEYINQFPAGRFKGFAPNLWRAFTDNDYKHTQHTWSKKGLDKLEYTAQNTSVEIIDETVNLYCLYALRLGKKTCYLVDVNYCIWASGALEVSASLEVVDDEAAAVDLARFGLSLEMPKEFDSIKYYGRGERENHPDFKEHAPVGIYSAKVPEMNEPYIYPQDNGVHCGVKWLEITDGNGNGVTVYAYDSLAFSAHNYTQDTLQKAGHQEDLADENTTFITLDGFIRGAGSASCGPDTLDEYKKDASLEELEVSFTIIPL